RPLVVTSLKSIESRLVSEVLTVVETTVWPDSECSIQPAQLEKVLNALEKELLSQYQSNRLAATNQSFEGVKKRFDNLKMLVDRIFTENANCTNIETYTYSDFVKERAFLSVQEQIDHVKNLP